MLISDIISRIRADLDDDRTVSYSSVSLLDRIRTELNDTANVTAAATTSVIASVRAKLGDPADSVLGTTTAASVTADSVIHYAQWSTSGSVTGTNAAINSAVNVASSSGSLSTYADDGIKTIKGMRPDALISGNLPGGFQNALNLYVLARCLEGEVETEVGSSGYQTFYGIFEKEVASVPPHISDAALSAFLSAGITEIISRRPDLGNTICNATLSPLENFVMAQAAQSKLGTAAHPNLDAFYSTLDSIPRHWTDAELNAFQTEALQTISSLRDDLVSNGQIRSDMVPALLFCISSLANNSGKDAASRNLSDAQWAKLVNLVKSLPYHWSDDQLLNWIHDSIRDIIRLRSDARMDDLGYELTAIETEPLISDEYPLRESFAKASEWFSAAGAISCRIGADSGSDVKYQQWMTRYQNEIRGAK